MRSKKPFLIALFLGIWIIITYLLLTRQGLDDVEQPAYQELQRSLDRLEMDIKAEAMTNRELVQKLLIAMNEIQKVKFISDKCIYILTNWINIIIYISAKTVHCSSKS